MFRILFLFCAVHVYAAFNLTWAVPAVSLDSNPPVGDTDLNPMIAIDFSGNAYATWGRTTGNNAMQEIWAATYNHASRVWSGAMKISGESHSANSQVVMDAVGNAIFVWEEGFPSKIVYRTLSSTGIWDPPLSQEPIRVYKSINAQVSPKIAMNEQGDAVVIWTESISGVHQICGAKKIPGQFWTSVSKISSSVNGVPLKGMKSVAVDENGQAVAVWEDSKGIYAAKNSSGSWSSQMEISSHAMARNPSLTMNRQGEVLVAWEEASQIFSKELKNGKFIEGKCVSNSLYKCRRPCLKLDRDGNAVIVFEKYDSIHKFIAGSYLSKGEKDWASPVDISAPSLAHLNEAGFPVLALNEIGDGVVIWKEFDGETMTIQGAGYSMGSWSFTKTLSSLGSHAAERFSEYDIDVALNLSGNILAIWPEDPMGLGSQHIKATTGVGLANIAPQPPKPDPLTLIEGVASGYQVVHRFPAHSDLINILTWTTNTPGAFYNIYRGNLSNLIGTSQKMYFEDHQRVPKQKETYLITVVDENGQESVPMTIVVHPK
jgi:hypothetical protein